MAQSLSALADFPGDLSSDSCAPALQLTTAYNLIDNTNSSRANDILFTSVGNLTPEHISPHINA